MTEADEMLAEAKRMLSEDLLSPQEYAERIVEITNLKSGISRADDDEKRRLQAAFAKARREKEKRKTVYAIQATNNTRAPLFSSIGALILSVIVYQLWAPKSSNKPQENRIELERHDTPVQTSPKAMPSNCNDAAT